MEWNDIPGDADFDALVQAVPGFGGQSDPDDFSGYAAGSQDVSAEGTLQIDAEHVASGPNYGLAAGEVVVTEAGDYWIKWAASLRAGSSSSRTEAESWVEIDQAEIPGTRSIHYLRLTNYGDTGGGAIKVSLPANAAVRIRAARTLGAAPVLGVANGSRLALEKV